MHLQQNFNRDGMKTTWHSFLPLIVISPEAYFTMCEIVDQAPEEVSWLGTVYPLENNVYFIKEVFLFKQECSSASTDILGGEGLGIFVQELMAARPESWQDIINHLGFWGHSHVNMSVGPSGTDETTLKEYVKDDNARGFAIRGIFNKRGEADFSIRFNKPTIQVDHAMWQFHMERPANIKETVKTELEAKVTKKVYTQSFPTGGYTGWQRTMGGSPDREPAITQIGRFRWTKNLGWVDSEKGEGIAEEEVIIGVSGAEPHRLSGIDGQWDDWEGGIN